MPIEFLLFRLESVINVCLVNKAGTKKQVFNLPVVPLTDLRKVTITVGLPLRIRSVATDAIAPAHVLVNGVER